MYANLRALRLSQNMTQIDFAASLGISKSTYNNYENGVREPKSDFWMAVAKKYDVTVDYLMGYSNDPHRSSELLFADERDIIAKYRQTNDEGKAAVRQVLDMAVAVYPLEKNNAVQTTA